MYKKLFPELYKLRLFISILIGVLFISIACLSSIKVDLNIIITMLIAFVILGFLHYVTHIMENKISDLVSGKLKPIFEIIGYSDSGSTIYIEEIKYHIYAVDTDENLYVILKKTNDSPVYAIQKKYAFICELLFQRDIELFNSLISDNSIKLSNN